VDFLAIPEIGVHGGYEPCMGFAERFAGDVFRDCVVGRAAVGDKVDWRGAEFHFDLLLDVGGGHHAPLGHASP
jgi:hypothetical protein